MKQQHDSADQPEGGSLLCSPPAAVNETVPALDGCMQQQAHDVSAYSS